MSAGSGGMRNETEKQGSALSDFLKKGREFLSNIFARGETEYRETAEYIEYRLGGFTYRKDKKTGHISLVKDESIAGYQLQYPTAEKNQTNTILLVAGAALAIFLLVK